MLPAVADVDVPRIHGGACRCLCSGVLLDRDAVVDVVLVLELELREVPEERLPVLPLVRVEQQVHRLLALDRGGVVLGALGGVAIATEVRPRDERPGLGEAGHLARRPAAEAAQGVQHANGVLGDDQDPRHEREALPQLGDLPPHAAEADVGVVGVDLPVVVVALLVVPVDHPQVGPPRRRDGGPRRGELGLIPHHGLPRGGPAIAPAVEHLDLPPVGGGEQLLDRRDPPELLDQLGPVLVGVLSRHTAQVDLHEEGKIPQLHPHVFGLVGHDSPTFIFPEHTPGSPVKERTPHASPEYW
ncbi:MAG: hypothetical protein COV59_01320 [Candidatus Magasanikbacteria bacterium CG11_big_fil_rev_8_21_14_0_20_39_34]|uniref:Uncharacterized protein n=1 Tax=Candidatus Magasanikbacteria bacterium CG11_big_fil_rev_8_21_14_0_20_39_34 TaxID=1974653 RepID=A0A2H0N632_9BACT|nr:MAG: hypothetical protein COV59_01320 [Candidatus Magasanikbacteria bacterium CG11_big_fil_rev_8_21_14_0_20_39_34]